MQADIRLSCLMPHIADSERLHEVVALMEELYELTLHPALVPAVVEAATDVAQGEAYASPLLIAAAGTYA